MRGITIVAAFAAVASATFGKEHQYRNTTIQTTTKVPQATLEKTVYTTLTTCPVTLTQHEGNKTYVTTKLTTKVITVTSCKGGCPHPPPTVVHPQPTPSVKTVDTTVYETVTTCPVTLTYTHDGKPTTITKLTTSVVTVTSCKGGCPIPPTHAPVPPKSTPQAPKPTPQPPQSNIPHPPVSMPQVEPPKPSSPPQNQPHPPASMPQAQPPKPSAPVAHPPAAPACPPPSTVTVTVYLDKPAATPAPQPSSKAPQPQAPQPTQKAPQPHPPQVTSSRAASQTSLHSKASNKSSTPVATASATPSCDPCQLQFNQCRQPSANGTSANQSFCNAQNAFCQSNVQSGFTISTDCTSLFNRCRAPTNGQSANQAFCAAQNLACTTAIASGFRPPPACASSNSTSSAVRSSAVTATPTLVPHSSAATPPSTSTPYVPATTNPAFLQCRKQSDACRGAPDRNFSLCNSQAAQCCSDAFDKCRQPAADGTSANQAECSAERVACFAYAGILDLIQPTPRV